MTLTKSPFPPHFSPFLLSTTSMPSSSLTTCLVLFLPSFFATLDWQTLSSGATTPQSSVPPNFPPVSIELCSSTCSISLELVSVCCSVTVPFTLLDFYTLHYLSCLKVISEDAYPVTMLDMSLHSGLQGFQPMQPPMLPHPGVGMPSLYAPPPPQPSMHASLTSSNFQNMGLWEMYLLQ